MNKDNLYSPSFVIAVMSMFVSFGAFVSFCTQVKKLDASVDMLSRQVSALKKENVQAVPSMPAASATANTEAPFPTDLIRNKPLADAWIKPVDLVDTKGCVTNPSGDLGGEIVNPSCAVWKYAVVSSDKTVTAEVVPLKGRTDGMKGELHFLKNGKKTSIPTLSVDAGTSVSVSFLDEQHMLVRRSGYEWYKDDQLVDGNWEQVTVPDSVLKAYPWEPKSPFDLTLGVKYDKYTETRWLPGAEGYFGTDPYRSKWALVYVVDRATQAIVSKEAVLRPE